MKREWWTPKLREARSKWAALRPQERLSPLSPQAKGFKFSSTRIIGPGLESRTTIRCGRPIFSDEWRTHIEMDLYDERVGRMVQAARGFEPEFRSIGFDVYSASNVLDGKDGNDWSATKFDFEDIDHQVPQHLAMYSAAVDRLWRSVGGCDTEGMQRLTLWALRNAKDIGAFPTDWGMICAAFIYGDSDLAAELLRLFQDQYEEHALREPNYELVRDIYVRVQPWFGRLRQLMGLPPSA